MGGREGAKEPEIIDTVSVSLISGYCCVFSRSLLSITGRGVIEEEAQGAVGVNRCRG